MAAFVDSPNVSRDMKYSYEGPVATDTTEDHSSSRFEKNNVLAMEGSLESSNMSTSNHNTSISKLDLSVYGNELSLKNPRRIGGVYAFLYRNGHPLIVIGPQCMK
jgi:hypothetical protein